jgi:hypothetical protein
MNFSPKAFVLRDFNYTVFVNTLLELKWTPESVKGWQEFYNNASRLVFFGKAGNFSYEVLPTLPKFRDLKPPPCKKGNASIPIHQNPFVFSH